MLILTRKLNQAIVIDGPCKVYVLGVERDRVKIGIQAPDGVTVLREELVSRNGNREIPFCPPTVHQTTRVLQFRPKT